MPTACEPCPGKTNATGPVGAGLAAPIFAAGASPEAWGALVAAVALFSARAFFFTFRSFSSQFLLTSSARKQLPYRCSPCKAFA